MARVFNNTIWSRRADHTPIKMGDLTVTQERTLFVYSDDYLNSGLPGMALLASPEAWGDQPVEFKTREGFPVHPRLMSIIPGEGRRNIQRRVFAKMLEKMGKPTTPGFETDWEMALMAGANTIGHLALFRDDIQAMQWFERPLSTDVVGSRSKFWRALREDISLDQTAFDPEVIREYIGPTPTAGGMIPKLLVSIMDPGHEQWDGGITRPGTPDRLDVILKIEPAEYRDVLTLEKLCLDLHERAGFVVPRSWLREIDGLKVLAVERFDCGPNGVLRPQETFRSVIATGDRNFISNDDVEMDTLPGYLEKLGQVCDLDVAAAKKGFYRRYLMAMLTGNGDMHLENVSFLGGNHGTTLSPVYDPAPMRAWPQHDTRSAIPVGFREAETWPHAIQRLGMAYGYTPAGWRELVERALADTATYLEELMALPIDQPRKNRLAVIVPDVRKEMQDLLDAGLKKSG